MSKILYNEIGPLGTPYQKGDWKKFAIHTDTEIKGFFGEYQFLSNFWPCCVTLDGVPYKSVELAYQASKWKESTDREYFTSCTSLQSIEYNRIHTPNGYTPDEWKAAEVSIMRTLLEQKFDSERSSECAELYAQLLATGTKHLEEMN